MNRTVPKVTPLKIGLEFSAHPTTREISEARIFDERLVPIGGEPGAEENAAIAAALHIARDAAPDKVLLHWSSAYPDHRLQSVPSLNGTPPFPFNNVTNPPALVGGRFAVTNMIDSPRQFFRLTE